MILKILFLLFLLYAAFVFFLYINQRQLIYFPYHFSPSPEEAGVPEMKVVTLKTEDGLNLTAWYRSPARRKLPTLVYLHGNAGSIGLRGGIVKPFLDAGYGVLLVTYRGYSGNPGKPDEKGLYQDGRAAIRFLHSQNVPDSCIVLYGESIGTAVAIQIATEYQVGGLILQSPFLSLGAIGQFHYPFLPVKWVIKDSFNSLKKVGQIHSPTLVLYGKNDDIIPPKFSIQIFEAIPPPKYIEPLQEIGHNDLFDSKFAIQFIQNNVKCE